MSPNPTTVASMHDFRKASILICGCSLDKNITAELVGLTVFQTVGKPGPADPNEYQTDFCQVL